MKDLVKENNAMLKELCKVLIPVTRSTDQPNPDHEEK